MRAFQGSEKNDAEKENGHRFFNTVAIEMRKKT